MTEERQDPGGTPPPGPEHLTATATTPGENDQSTPRVAPGTYQADEQDRERGRAVKSGN